MDAGFRSVMGRSKPGNRGLYIGDVVGYKAKSREAIVQVTNSMQSWLSPGKITTE